MSSIPLCICSCSSTITPSGGKMSLSLFFTIVLVQRLSSWLDPPVQSRVIPLSREVGTGCNLLGRSNQPVEGLKSTSDVVLLFDLRRGLTDAEEGGVKSESKGSFEGEESWYEVMAVSGVIILSRFIRASRRALSCSARWTSWRIRGSILLHVE